MARVKLIVDPTVFNTPTQERVVPMTAYDPWAHNLKRIKQFDEGFQAVAPYVYKAGDWIDDAYKALVPRTGKLSDAEETNKALLASQEAEIADLKARIEARTEQAVDRMAGVDWRRGVRFDTSRQEDALAARVQAPSPRGMSSNTSKQEDALAARVQAPGPYGGVDRLEAQWGPAPSRDLPAQGIERPDPNMNVAQYRDWKEGKFQLPQGDLPSSVAPQGAYDSYMQQAAAFFKNLVGRGVPPQQAAQETQAAQRAGLLQVPQGQAQQGQQGTPPFGTSQVPEPKGEGWPAPDILHDTGLTDKIKGQQEALRMGGGKEGLNSRVHWSRLARLGAMQRAGVQGGSLEQWAAGPFHQFLVGGIPLSYGNYIRQLQASNDPQQRAEGDARAKLIEANLTKGWAFWSQDDMETPADPKDMETMATLGPGAQVPGQVEAMEFDEFSIEKLAQEGATAGRMVLPAGTRPIPESLTRPTAVGDRVDRARAQAEKVRLAQLQASVAALRAGGTGWKGGLPRDAASLAAIAARGGPGGRSVSLKDAVYMAQLAEDNNESLGYRDWWDGRSAKEAGQKVMKTWMEAQGGKTAAAAQDPETVEALTMKFLKMDEKSAKTYEIEAKAYTDHEKAISERLEDQDTAEWREAQMGKQYADLKHDYFHTGQKYAKKTRGTGTGGGRYNFAPLAGSFESRAKNAMSQVQKYQGKQADQVLKGIKDLMAANNVKATRNEVKAKVGKLRQALNTAIANTKDENKKKKLILAQKELASATGLKANFGTLSRLATEVQDAEVKRLSKELGKFETELARLDREFAEYGGAAVAVAAADGGLEGAENLMNKHTDFWQKRWDAFERVGTAFKGAAGSKSWPRKKAAKFAVKILRENGFDEAEQRTMYESIMRDWDEMKDDLEGAAEGSTTAAPGGNPPGGPPQDLKELGAPDLTKPPKKPAPKGAGINPEY
jgi:hypothetical protein